MYFLLFLFQIDVKVVATENALHFINQEEIKKLGIEIQRDQDEWQVWLPVQDHVLTESYNMNNQCLSPTPPH